MSFGPHDIADIDQAWEDKLGGLTLAGSGEAVTFFQEEPNVDGTPQRTFPSISLMLIGLVDDDARREGAPDKIKVSEDTGPTPPLSNMQARPQPYRLLYTVDTWAKGRARDDRELIQHVIEQLGARGVLTNPTSGDLHNTFRVGFANLDEADADVRIYHKAFTYEVEVCMGPKALEQVEQAIQFNFDVKGSKALDGPVRDDPNLVLDLTLNITG